MAIYFPNTISPLDIGLLTKSSMVPDLISSDINEAENILKGKEVQSYKRKEHASFQSIR